jgi:Leucine-rich repeat (LRR) protein
VHTNPNDAETLQVATGDARLLVIVIDGETDSTVYVGPVFSYYEFWQPAGQRLTDQEWRSQLATRAAPPGPDWVNAFAAPIVARGPEEPRVTVMRRADILWVTSASASGTSGESVPLSARELPRVARHRNLHSLDLSHSNIDDEALRSLSGMPDLRSLDLSETKITDAGVAVLAEHRNLQSLDLSQTGVTDVALPPLVKLPYLSQLDLRETQITEAAVRELRRQMPHTEVQH